MLVVGVDACTTGWIAVVLADGERPQARYVPSIDALGSVAGDAAALAIDMPIGLPTEGARHADLLARAFVGPRRNSVFLTPVREAIEAHSHAAATRAAAERTGVGISQQAYGLARKFLEVERWLPRTPCPVYEVHPEVSFTVLLQHPARASKKSWAGMVERRQALEGAGICLDRIDGDAAVRAAVDDVLDAAVAAWSAARIARGLARSFPDPPQASPAGRPVAIWA